MVHIVLLLLKNDNIQARCCLPNLRLQAPRFATVQVPDNNRPMYATIASPAARGQPAPAGRAGGVEASLFIKQICA
jgi:hypothetical protein